MARNRKSARVAGSKFERDVGLYLTLNLGTKVYRTGKKGSMDSGDLFGLSIGGKQSIIECKSPGKNSPWKISGWWSETEVEVNNCFAEIGILTISRFGKPIKDSVCIVDMHNFEKIEKKLPESITITEIKNGVSAIKDNLSIETILKQKVFGKDEFWYIFPLELLINISDREVPRVSVIQDVSGGYESYISVDSNDVVMAFYVSDSDKEVLSFLPEKSNNKPQYEITLSKSEIDEYLNSKTPIQGIPPYPLGIYLHKSGDEVEEIEDEVESIIFTEEELDNIKNGKIVEKVIRGQKTIFST